MKLPRFFVFLGLSGLPAARGAEPAPEIVVAVRYPQQTGTSHAHLYLYREDGKLLRQLTNDDTGQDFAPVFSPDGETIVFGRDLGTGATEYYSVAPRGGVVHRVKDTPDWYDDFNLAPTFGDRTGVFTIEATSGAHVHRAPDGSVELVLRKSVVVDEQKPQGRDFLLRDLKDGRETRFGDLPGFEELQDVLFCREAVRDGYFLWSGTLHAVFFSTHLNSTDGNTVHALDLEHRRLVRLSPNFAAPIPLPGESAFLTYTENRYVPFGDGKRTANSTYVEHWDANLKAIRYAKERVAGVCYGASMYRPGRIMAVINIKGEDVPPPSGGYKQGKPGETGEGGL